MSDWDSSDILAITSLLISVIAFFIAVAQALQQYVSTAEGYRKCARSVTGPWSNYRHRIFEWREFRFSVEFQTPVMFVAPPANKRGPVADQPVYNVDGSEESFKNTRTLVADLTQAQKGLLDGSLLGCIGAGSYLTSAVRKQGHKNIMARTLPKEQRLIVNMSPYTDIVA